MAEENQNPEITLTLTLNEVNAILTAIQELPAKVANPITEKIRTQGIAQVQPVSKVEAEVVN